jgi:hypothetical protein
MKPAKSTKKKASAPKAPKTNLNVNVDYVNEICDEAIATIMALRSLVAQLAAQQEDHDAR